MLKKHFKIDSNIYSNKDDLLQAVEDFWEFGASFDEKESRIEIEWEDEFDITQTFNELMNYMVILYNERI